MKVLQFFIIVLAIVCIFGAPNGPAKGIKITSKSQIGPSSSSSESCDSSDSSNESSSDDQSARSLRTLDIEKAAGSTYKKQSLKSSTRSSAFASKASNKNSSIAKRELFLDSNSEEVTTSNKIRETRLSNSGKRDRFDSPSSLSTSDESNESSETSSGERKSFESSSSEHKSSKSSSGEHNLFATRSAEHKPSESSNGEHKSTKSSSSEDGSSESEVNASIQGGQKSFTSNSSKYNNNSKSRGETRESLENHETENSSKSSSSKSVTLRKSKGSKINLTDSRSESSAQSISDSRSRHTTNSISSNNDSSTSLENATKSLESEEPESSSIKASSVLYIKRSDQPRAKSQSELKSTRRKSTNFKSINDKSSEESHETKEESGEMSKCSNEFASKAETKRPEQKSRKHSQYSRTKTSYSNPSRFNTNSKSVTRPTSISSESVDSKIFEHSKGSEELSQNKESDKKSDESSNVPKEFWEFWKLWESWKKWNANDRNVKRNDLTKTAVDSSRGIGKSWNPKQKYVTRESKETSAELHKDKELDRRAGETWNYKPLNDERQLSAQSADNSTKAHDFTAILKITTEINSWKSSTELSLMRLIIEINGYALRLQNINTNNGNWFQKGCEVRQFIIERGIANLDKHVAGITKNLRHAIMKSNTDLKKMATQLHANIRILRDSVSMSGKELSSNIVDILNTMHERVSLTIRNLRIKLLRFFHNNEKFDVTTSGSQSDSAVQSRSLTSSGSEATSSVHNNWQTPTVSVASLDSDRKSDMHSDAHVLLHSNEQFSSGLRMESKGNSNMQASSFSTTQWQPGSESDSSLQSSLHSAVKSGLATNIYTDDNAQAASKFAADQGSNSKFYTQQNAQASESGTITDTPVPSTTAAQLGSLVEFHNHGNNSPISPVLNTHHDLQRSEIQPYAKTDSRIHNASERGSVSAFQAESVSNPGSKEAFDLAINPQSKPVITDIAGWPTDIGLSLHPSPQTVSNSDRQEIHDSSVSLSTQTGTESISNTGWQPVFKPMTDSSAQSQSASQFAARPSADSPSQLLFINQPSVPQGQEQPASDLSLIDQSSIFQSQGQSASDSSSIIQSSIPQTQVQTASDLSLLNQSPVSQGEGQYAPDLSSIIQSPIHQRQEQTGPDLSLVNESPTTPDGWNRTTFPNRASIVKVITHSTGHNAEGSSSAGSASRSTYESLQEGIPNSV